jgi:hypothetical protein
MSDLSRSDKMLAEKTVCVLLVRGEGTGGQPVYAYVGVRADRLEAFIKAQQSGEFFPEDYGVIIASGEGEPSDEIKAQMERDYGFNHQSMTDIPDLGSAKQVAKKLADVARDQKLKDSDFDA